MEQAADMDFSINVKVFLFTALLGLFSYQANATDTSSFEATCLDIGFKKKTEAYADCVIELVTRDKQAKSTSHTTKQKDTGKHIAKDALKSNKTKSQSTRSSTKSIKPVTKNTNREATTASTETGRETAEHERQTRLLNLFQPDWKELASSDDFSTWQKTLPTDEQEALQNTWDAIELAKYFTQFKNWKNSKLTPPKISSNLESLNQVHSTDAKHDKHLPESSTPENSYDVTIHSSKGIKIWPFIILIMMALPKVLIAYTIGLLFIRKLNLTKTALVSGFFATYLATTIGALTVAETKTADAANHFLIPAAFIASFLTISILALTGTRKHKSIIISAPDNWFFMTEDKRQQGPISLDALTSLNLAGIITKNSLVLAPTCADWLPFHEAILENVKETSTRSLLSNDSKNTKQSYIKNETTTSIGVIFIFFKKLFYGDFGLAKTYWVYGIIVGGGIKIIINIITNTPLLFGLLTVFSIYDALLLAGIWNAASKYKGSEFLAFLSKLVVIIGAIFWLALFNGLIIYFTTAMNNIVFP